MAAGRDAAPAGDDATRGERTDARARVLVVDDDAVNRRLLSRLVEREGYAVAVAHDGREALDLVLGDARIDVDVVLLDILMPELDGFDVLRALKSDERVRHLPVIMISALEETDAVRRCIEQGATDYLQKPFDPTILRARLGASLAEKRLRDTELEYLEQVRALTRAAEGLEAGAFDPVSLGAVRGRDDALGSLARVFTQMAAEVEAREARLTAQVRELRVEIDEARKRSQVAQITGSEYFHDLRAQAREIRGMLDRE